MYFKNTSPDDSVTQNGILLFTDDATIQCVAVAVLSVSSDSCFSLSLSATTTVSGLTLNPDQATICVVPADGRYHILFKQSIQSSILRRLALFDIIVLCLCFFAVPSEVHW